MSERGGKMARGNVGMLSKTRRSVMIPACCKGPNPGDNLAMPHGSKTYACLCLVNQLEGVFKLSRIFQICYKTRLASDRQTGATFLETETIKESLSNKTATSIVQQRYNSWTL